MKLIDADALREQLLDTARCIPGGKGHKERRRINKVIAVLAAAPSITCDADNPHGLVPSKCPACGEELVPAPCMDLAMDSYRDGILYGQQHPEWGIDG